MYLQFYQLRTNPFHTTPDPALFFPSALHTTILASLHASVDKGESLVVISGDAGLGKTLLLRTLLAELDEQKTCALLIPQTIHLSFNALLCQVLQSFGVKIESRDTATLLSQVRSELIKERILRRKALLILDDAHNLPLGTLRQLPTLARLEQPAEQLLQIVLAGHPALEEACQLCLGELSDSSHYVLTPLPVHDSMAYIQYRLQHVTLSPEPIFTDDALEVLAIRSQGIPAVLHQLAQRLLVAGCIAQQKPLTAEHVQHLLESTPVHSLAVRQRWHLSRRTLGFLGGGGLAAGLLLTLLGRGTMPPAPQRQEVPAAPVAPRSGPPAALARLADSPPPVQGPSTPAIDAEPPSLLAPPPGVPEELALVPPAPLETPPHVQAVANTTEPVPKKFPLRRMVKPGDTLWSLATATYGSGASRMLPRLKAANPQLRDSQHLLAGTVLTFPDPRAPLPAPPAPSGTPRTARPVQTVQNAPLTHSVQNVVEATSPPPEPPPKRGILQFFRKAFQRHGPAVSDDSAAAHRSSNYEGIDRPSQ